MWQQEPRRPPSHLPKGNELLGQLRSGEAALPWVLGRDDGDTHGSTSERFIQGQGHDAAKGFHFNSFRNAGFCFGCQEQA